MRRLNPSEATKVLDYFFVGSTFQRVSLGDWVIFNIEGITFQAHEVTFPQQNDLLTLFRSAPFAALELPGRKATADDADPLKIVGAVAVRRILYQIITSVRLLEDSSLEFRFDSEDILCFSTKVKAVNWFWRLADEDIHGKFCGEALLCTGPNEIWADMEKIAKWPMPFKI